MNTAGSLRPPYATHHPRSTNHAAPPRALFLTVALAGLVGSCPERACAYGDYEERIMGNKYVRDDSPLPLPNLDAPQLFSQAFFTPPPVDNDFGLAAIEGSLNPDNGDFADMYCIYIGGRFKPEDFRAAMESPNRPKQGEAEIADPQLFLFDSMGHPVVGNDDTDDVNLQPSIPAGTITKEGVYVLAITGSGYDPTDAAMNLLFETRSTGLKMPTNAAGVQAGWSGTHNQVGRYRIHLGSNEHWPIPEPGTFAPLLIGLGGVTLRRKSRLSH